MLNENEKKIISKLKQMGIEKNSIIPTMLIIKGLEDCQNKLLNYLNTIQEITEDELIRKIEEMGFLENNPNIE